MENESLRYLIIGAIAVVVLVFAGALLTGESCRGCGRSFHRARKPPLIELVFTPMPGGGHYVEEKAQIPEELRVGCHVCPRMCALFDLGNSGPRAIVLILSPDTGAWHL